MISFHYVECSEKEKRNYQYAKQYVRNYGINQSKSVRRSHGKYGFHLVYAGYGFTSGEKSAGLDSTTGPRQLTRERVPRDGCYVPRKIRQGVVRNQRTETQT